MMIDKRLIFNIVKSKIAINGLWLYALQIFDSFIPLITLPYITRVLGPSNYGVFSTALNLVGYFLVIVEYGFNLTGARKVAITNRHDDELSEIYSKITFSKLGLCGITFVLMLMISLVLNLTKTEYICMFILYIMVIGSALQQTWLFQGLQEMKYISLISIVSRTLSVIMIFIFVNSTEDVYLYCTLYSSTFLLMGIASCLIIKIKYKIRIIKIRVKDILLELKDGWHLFTTSALSKIFSGIGITILIITSTETSVGIYSAIQKIPTMLIMLYNPIGQVIFPYVSSSYKASFNQGLKKVKSAVKFVMPIMILMSIILIIWSEAVIKLLYGSEYSSFSGVMIPLTIWMVLSVLNNLIGIQILVASGHTKEYSRGFRIGLIALLLLNIIIVPFGEIYGVAIATMLSEFTLTIALIYYVKKIIRRAFN